MDASDFRRGLIKAANRRKMTAREVASMLDWFENLPAEVFNELRGVDFPNGYIKCWQDLGDENGEED